MVSALRLILLPHADTLSTENYGVVGSFHFTFLDKVITIISHETLAMIYLSEFYGDDYKDDNSSKNKLIYLLTKIH